MCMIDGAERYYPETDEWRTARKEHRCGECNRTIRRGERHHVGGGAMEGDWYTHRTCAHCATVREWLRAECSGWVYEAVAEDLLEHFREGMGIWLGRAVVGMRRQWRRRDGTAMPVMALPGQDAGAERAP